MSQTLRNVAIIAHVDHGKTTLVDAMFRQSGLFREGQEVADRLMDNMDLERERGITISAKNCAIVQDNVRINIIDTPGHADFGGEVERALKMADGAILLVDAAEGPLPQTRFVLQKALTAGLAMVVVINKVDRADARAEEVLDQVYDLFIDLGGDDTQLDFPVLYAIGREGRAGTEPDNPGTDLQPLFRTIVDHIPAPSADPDAPFQMLVTDLGFSEYLGRLAIGRVINGTVKAGEALVRIGPDGQKPLKVSALQHWHGPGCVDADHIDAGDVMVLAGVDDVLIGDTICTRQQPVALPRITVDEPTVAMRFTVNTSPRRGQEGKILQGNRIFARLQRESMQNVAIRVEMTDEPDTFIVKGRGELQMAILIETMRREGYELAVGRPEVIMREGTHGREEPIEHLVIDCDEAYTGIVTEKLSQRKGKMLAMQPTGSSRVRLEFSVPSRGLIGFRDAFLSDTRGTGVMNGYLEGYEPYRGDFPVRRGGSIVADRTGTAIPYALYSLEARGELFVAPGEAVYEGMIIGHYNKDGDLNVNATRTKKMTNVRASGKDDAVTLSPVPEMTLERAIRFLAPDELVEVTPQCIRLRKGILSMQQRHTARARSLGK